MKKEWNEEEPIEVFFNQIEEAAEHAQCGNAPFTNAQVLNTAFVVMAQTKIFKDVCKEYISHLAKLEQSNAVLNTNTSKLEEHRTLRLGKDKKLWIHSFSNELGSLTQGVRDIKGADYITFIK